MEYGAGTEAKGGEPRLSELRMRMSELEYELPAEAIATRPAEPRDQSRLMVVRRGDPSVEHRRFREISDYLRRGDLLVVNDTRVLPARLELRRKSGAVIVGLFLREPEPGLWEVMLRSRGKVREGEELVMGKYGLRLIRRKGEGLWEAVVVAGGEGATIRAGEVLAEIGHVPLPPYIGKRRKACGTAEETSADRAWYQTVFAREEAGRSVAAPTAGLHFTPELLERLEAAGVRRAAVELDVGLGTFLPVETETLEEHQMHVERYRVPAKTVQAIRETRAAGGRIVVIGTTAVRTLEAAAEEILNESRPPTEIGGETDLKIGPSFKFRLTDVLVTNFHLPRSTLMALVAAFLGERGVEQLKKLYALAIQERYRFYSYGDAMLIMNG